jgi:hypothetical protein
MENGQLVEKLILWKAEVMLGIQNNSEEGHRHLDQQCTGVQITPQINSLRPTHKKQLAVELSGIVSTLTVYIGTKKEYILISMTIAIVY